MSDMDLAGVTAKLRSVGLPHDAVLVEAANPFQLPRIEFRLFGVPSSISVVCGPSDLYRVERALFRNGFFDDAQSSSVAVSAEVAVLAAITLLLAIDSDILPTGRIGGNNGTP